MPASSKRMKRVKMRERDEAHTGIYRRAKKVRFDTNGETPEVAQDLGNRKKFHPHDLANITPMNEVQEDFLEAYFRGCELLIADGPAGTAKTFLSLFCALSDVLEPSTPQSQILVVRSAVPSRDQGFLPGDEDEKNAPFEEPYKQIAKEILPAFKNPYDHLKALGYLKFKSTSYLKGITVHDTVVIVDEFSSCTYQELSNLITRIGDHSKIIFAGDLKQSDLNLTREQSGYQQFLHVVEGMRNQDTVAYVQYGLEHIVRSGLVKDFLISDYYNG